MLSICTFVGVERIWIYAKRSIQKDTKKSDNKGTKLYLDLHLHRYHHPCSNDNHNHEYRPTGTNS